MSALSQSTDKCEAVWSFLENTGLHRMVSKPASSGKVASFLECRSSPSPWIRSWDHSLPFPFIGVSEARTPLLLAVLKLLLIRPPPLPSNKVTEWSYCSKPGRQWQIWRPGNILFMWVSLKGGHVKGVLAPFPCSRLPSTLGSPWGLWAS